MSGVALPPVGTIALLFTDIAGSTQLARAAGSRWGGLLADHHAIVGAAITAEGGWIDGTEGDAFFATFADPAAAARAALAAQRTLAAHPWPADLDPVRVRMGLHVGYVERADLGYVGLEVHRAARIASAAHGGQVLLSSAAAQMTAAVWSCDPLGAHRLKDFPQSEQLLCAVIDGRGAAAFPPPRTDLVQATNLPAGQTPLIGRETDRARVIESLMVERERVVTLIGRSGAGKTSLALAVASDLLSNFPGGVWLVRLAALSDDRGVMGAIAAVLSTSSDPGDSPHDITVRRLRERGPTLLVLDNCEHVLGAVPELGRLLEELPDLQILASSQAPLRIPEEVCLPLDRLDDGAALALIERVIRRRNPAASIAGHDREIVLELVTLLDGLPLALELAAARLVLLSPAQLVKRLRESVDVIADERSNRPERHRSLQATVDWTLGLLEPGPKTLFARLGVFAGPVELEEIEAVCDGDGVDVLADLFRLLEVALVRRVEDGDGQIRFGLPEGLRHISRVRFGDSPEAERLRERHAARQLDIVWRVRHIYATTNTDYDAAVRAAPERQVALEWARKTADHRHPRMALAHACLCAERGQMREAAALIEELLADPPTDAGVHSILMQAAVWLNATSGQREIAIAIGEHALANAPDVESRAMVLEILSLAHSLGGDPAEAVRTAEEARSLADSLSDILYGTVLLLSAQARLVSGDLDLAAEYLEAGEALSESTNSCFAWRRLTMKGDLAASRGELPEALSHYSESLEEAERRRHDHQTLFDTIGSALALAAIGDDSAAVEVMAIARALAREIGTPGAEAVHIFDIAPVDVARGRLGESAAASANARGGAVAPARRVSRICELNRIAAGAGSSVR